MFSIEPWGTPEEVEEADYLEKDCIETFRIGREGGTGFLLRDGRNLALETDHDMIYRCLPEGWGMRWLRKPVTR